jgi:DNA mismatch endonuclease (patch repair protein)
MADVFTREQRSALMALVRSKGNASTEQRLIGLLRENRLGGWRRGLRIPGSPDFVWQRERVALFVDGCFWHGCPRHASMPADNRPYWELKLSRNKARDRAVTRALRAAGWRVIRVWECGLRTKRQAATIRRIKKTLGRE